MKIWIGAALLLVLVSLLIATAIPYRSEAVSFLHGDTRLAGDLLLPDARESALPVVIFVHGDGTVDRSCAGYYQPYYDALLAAGIGVFSWDKPGVGESEGNWLDQTMADRSAEVAAAVRYLRSRPEVDAKAIGLLGFSQAGWVMPQALAQDPDLAFGVFISTAIGWREQGDYLTRQRLASLGLSQQQLQESMAYNQALDQRLAQGMSYGEYQTYRGQHEPEFFQGSEMSPSRFRFAVNNMAADARRFLPHIRQPVLALFGDSDRNVDVQQSINEYKTHIQSDFSYRVYADVDHGLFKNQYFADQPKDSLWFWLKMIVLGAEGLAPGVGKDITAWIQQR